MRNVLSLGVVVVVAAVALIGQGCRTASYGEYYRSISLEDYPRTSNVHAMTYSDELFKKLQGEGAIVIGESSFNGEAEEAEYAIRQARKVGADIVLLGASYTATAHTLAPIPAFQPGTTYATGSTGPSVDSSGAGPAAVDNRVEERSGPSYGPFSTEMYDQRALYLRTKRAR